MQVHRLPGPVEREQTSQADMEPRSGERAGVEHEPAAGGEPAPPPEVAAPPRIDALTGLRFLLALMVMFSHLRVPQSSQLLQTAFGSGYSGVSVFFVLSGFVLTHNYYERFAREFDGPRLRSFFVARFARIYPVYLFLLVWASLPALCSGETRGSLWLEHALMLQAWDPLGERALAFNGPGWSVSVELFLYCCFPLLILGLAPLLRTLRGQLLTAGVVLGAMSVAACYFAFGPRGTLHWTDPDSAHRWLYRMPLTRLGDFVLGIVAARFLARGGPIRDRHGALLVAASVIAFVGLTCLPSGITAAPSWDVAYAVPALLLIFGLAAAPRCAAARVLSTRGMLLLGESSYALYLCHYQLLEKLRWQHVPPDSWVIERAMAMAMIVAVSVGLHVVLERPARSFLRQWWRPRQASGQATPPAARWQRLAGAVGLAALGPLLLGCVQLVNAARGLPPARDLTYESLIQRSLMLLDAREAEASLALLDQADALRPDTFLVNLNRCVAHGVLEQRQAAVSACQRALALRPGNELARNNLAWVARLGNSAAN